MSDQLLAILREIEEELEEVSASGAAGGYQTPHAFTPGEGEDNIWRKKVDKMRARKNPDDKDKGNTIGEGVSKYNLYKMDESATAKQKIGRAISEVNRRLNEIHQILDMNSRLKTENNMESSALWKRTGKHLMRLETKLQAISQRIRELKS